MQRNQLCVSACHLLLMAHDACKKHFIKIAVTYLQAGKADGIELFSQRALLRDAPGMRSYFTSCPRKLSGVQCMIKY